MYLNLSVVTDGFDWKRSFEWTVGISGLQLNDCFCSPHQARHCTFILQKLFFLFLGNKSEDSEANSLCSLFSQGCAQMQLPQESLPSRPLWTASPSPPARPPCGLVVFFRPSHLPPSNRLHMLLFYWFILFIASHPWQGSCVLSSVPALTVVFRIQKCWHVFME